MKKLNIVYTYMQESRFEIAMPEKDAVVVWTAAEEPDADIVVYHSGYSYDPKQRKLNPDACRILYMYEPLIVYPKQFLRSFWSQFDYVLTWCDELVEQGGKFIKFPSLYYDFPFGAAHGVAGNPVCPESWQSKKRAICQIAGNKYSFVSSELYSRRRSIARWFGRNGQLKLDTFGVPPMPVPGYQGRSENKQETLSAYRYSLCLENDSHPLWSRGYVTEKIFDCFYAFTVPVYLGASNIDTYIPSECYIDLRKFASLDELDQYLADMPDDEFYGYLQAMERFLEKYDAQNKHSCFRVYEKALELAEGNLEPLDGVDPYGFWQKASLVEKGKCALMMTMLPVYKSIKGTRYSGAG